MNPKNHLVLYYHPGNTTAIMRMLEAIIQNKKNNSVIQNKAQDVLIKLIYKVKMPIDIASNTFIVGLVDNNHSKERQTVMF